VALPILVGVGYGLGLLITTLAFRLLRRWRSELAPVLSTFMAGPVRLLILVLFLSLARRPLRPSLTMSRMLTALEQIVLILALAWLVLRVVESIEEIARNRALRRDRTILLPLLPVVRKTAKILIATLAGLAVLHSFGVNVITVLAGLGIGGIAVALAAQKTLENFIGSITLYADQPVRVGELCRFGGTLGTVEEVGLRSTRVRTLDRTVVTIPNGEFSNFQIENFARRDRIWYHPTLGLRYETTPDQIRYVLVEVRRLLYAHPKVDSASARIRFVDFGSSSLDLEVFSYVTVTDYGEYLEVAEDLNLRMMDIVAAAGSSVAFPSQTTYVEQGSGLDPDRTRAAEARVQAWRARGELYLPRLPPEKIAEIDNTLPYPADGSATCTGPGRG
jgi:MscS family membrane protein